MMIEKLIDNNLKIIVFDELTSTNSYLYERMSEGHDVLDNVVVARYQTSGKGMGKNRWESNAGENLLFSMALDVSFLKAEEQFKISQAVSTALSDVVDNHISEAAPSAKLPHQRSCPISEAAPSAKLSHQRSCHISEAVTSAKLSHQPQAVTSIKWPNDIYIGDKKLAGMLIQNTLSGMMMKTTIIGVGLNVNQMGFSKDVPNPVSLKMITGKNHDLDSLLEAFVSNIMSSVERLKTDSGRLCVDNLYKSKLFRAGLWADYEYEGVVKPMMITGYDKYGRLCLIDKNDHTVCCDIKEIKFIS